jgi:hypothetical protein
MLLLLLVLLVLLVLVLLLLLLVLLLDGNRAAQAGRHAEWPPCTAGAPTLCGTPAAGEGSYGQLVRRFGAAGAAQVVSNLGAVWISHIHADHHAGLPRLLAVSHLRVTSQAQGHQQQLGHPLVLSSAGWRLGLNVGATGWGRCGGRCWGPGRRRCWWWAPAPCAAPCTPTRSWSPSPLCTWTMRPPWWAPIVRPVATLLRPQQPHDHAVQCWCAGFSTDSLSRPSSPQAHYVSLLISISKCEQAGAEVPEEAAGHLAAAKARLGLTRLQSVRVHHCAQVSAWGQVVFSHQAQFRARSCAQLWPDSVPHQGVPHQDSCGRVAFGVSVVYGCSLHACSKAWRHHTTTFAACTGLWCRADGGAGLEPGVQRGHAALRRRHRRRKGRHHAHPRGASLIWTVTIWACGARPAGCLATLRWQHPRRGMRTTSSCWKALHTCGWFGIS